MIFNKIPTPMSGLALGISSVGVSIEYVTSFSGIAQCISATIGALLLFFVLLKFISTPKLLIDEIKQPIIGSVLPTFAMCLMVLSKTLSAYNMLYGELLWGVGVFLHLIFLMLFIFYRIKEPILKQIVPSWFIPPVGIIVADVTCPNDYFIPIAKILFYIGSSCYFFLLPLIICRFIFLSKISESAKSTVAVLAAPASLSLAGYLTITPDPSLLICAVLFGIAVLMTTIVYFSFFSLLKLDFSPGYAAFTFPMAIGSTALYKLSEFVGGFQGALEYSKQIYTLATLELIIAIIVIIYVSFMYIKKYLPSWSVIMPKDSK